uniref:Uncharacterized protein n=1 Tax=Arundo donax TaxID=35708 RepID=A0A0A9ICQ7_ARUDO
MAIALPRMGLEPPEEKDLGMAGGGYSSACLLGWSVSLSFSHSNGSAGEAI